VTHRVTKGYRLAVRTEFGEVGAEGAGGDGEADVVDGAAEGVLDPLELGQVEGGPGDLTVGADARRIERDLRRRAGEVPGHLPEAGEAVAGAARGVGGVTGGAAEPAAGPAGGVEDAGGGAARERGARGRGLGPPGLGGRRRLGPRLD